MNRRIMLFSFLLTPFLAKAQTPEKREISTPNGSVTLTTQTVDPTPQKIELVDAKELMRIQESSKGAAEFALAYLPAGAHSLRDFDEAFRLWQREEVRQFSEEDVIERLGARLGEKLAADFEMEWVLVTDEYGTDYAVRGKKYEVFSYPFSSVAKRVQKDQYDFMEGVYYAVRESIESGKYKVR